ncbi:MAG: DNA/RNA helicase domain-containing protein, partial [Raoultibacter sp.]
MKVIPTEAVPETPKGASFVIDRCPFRYGQQIDMEVLDLAEDKVINWPMVYILANEKDAYIGQTTSVANRISQHGASEEKKDFTSVNIVFNEEFNASVVTDYEHRLIGLMHADGRYRLTNKNDGMTDTNYFSKSRYAAMFDDLWEDLRRLELADQTIGEIEESEVFKYSPYKGLTPDQRVALDKILEAIGRGLDKAEPIVVEGMPGTGKTILAIYLLKALKDDPKYAGMNVRIIEPVTSLRNTLKKSLKRVSGMTKGDIIGPADLVKTQYGYVQGEKKCFDIVLVDESHRLKCRKNLGTQYGNYDKVNKELGLSKEATQIDWILDQVKLPIFFYDPLQTVGPSCIKGGVVQSLLGDAVAHPIGLDSQMRVKGGKEYLDHVSALLAGEDSEPGAFEGYDFVLHEKFSSFVDSFDRTFGEHNLSRMVAGYAWEWKTRDEDKNGQELYDIEIDGIGKRWNCTYDNWVVKGADNPSVAHEVGCIHSIQGYDLSYAYVIVGDDIKLNPLTGQLEADENSYFDRNGRATASPEELTQYIKNIYYVLLTR